jgi:hypothetical protein
MHGSQVKALPAAPQGERDEDDIQGGPPAHHPDLGLDPLRAA